jgi:nucleoside-diphosphate kinase
MAIERTLSIVKPDAVAAGNAGNVIAAIEAAGLKPIAIRMTRLSKQQAEGFYAVHRERGFFDELTTFMSSGPVVIMALEAEDAIKRYRDLMGATNPANAAEGTLRAKFAKNVGENAVHGSDAPETAAVEIAYFFNGLDIAAGAR